MKLLTVLVAISLLLAGCATKPAACPQDYAQLGCVAQLPVRT